MSKVVRIGIIDSGLSLAQQDHVYGECCFAVDEDGDVTSLPTHPDRIGHGTAICDIITHHAPRAQIYNAQVFSARSVTSAATVAAAIDWLMTQDIQIINLSLGLVEDRPVLKKACARALATGVILVASSPAQGRAVYPSAYEGVIRATGDARCDVGEISFLNSVQADFGGCARPLNSSEGQPLKIGGASMGTAHVTGQIIAFLQNGGERHLVWEWLVSRANYVHSERRTQ
ncbi:MAG: S8 family serine peptidase [Emcibacter sp.]|nr:S8 family serine peptidase [Emcibacter sp.]